MQDNFDKALRHVLKHEGGYSDHPSDPGGATKFGITHQVLAEYRGREVSKDDVKALTLDEASAIYRTRYWQAASCDALPAGVDLAVFDCAVNQGVSRARRFLQQAARVSADGIIGPLTLAAVARTPPRELLNEFMARRMRAYGLLGSLFRTFGLGWSRRLMAVHSEAHAMRRGPEPQNPPSPTPSPPRSSAMDFFIKRLREPSTFAGIAAFMASIGLLGLTEQEWNQIFGAVAAVAAAAAVFFKESPSEADSGATSETSAAE